MQFIIQLNIKIQWIEFRFADRFADTCIHRYLQCCLSWYKLSKIEVGTEIVLKIIFLTSFIYSLFERTKTYTSITGSTCKSSKVRKMPVGTEQCCPSTSFIKF